MIILVVEDEPILAMSLETDLVNAGFKVVGPVASHAAAIKLAASNPVDLALINIDLKNGGSGIDLADDLTKLWKIPCLFVSGNRQDAYDNHTVALGYISKPYDSSIVIASILAVQKLLAGDPDRSGLPLELEMFDLRA
jgi:two-component system, response regulator PdtaR